MQFSIQRITKLLLSCKTEKWTLEDLQIASVLITGHEINESEYSKLPIESMDDLILYFYKKQPSNSEMMLNAFNLLDTGTFTD